MLNNPPKEKEWISWIFVCIWSFIIFLTIPFARSLQIYVSQNWGREKFGYFVILIIVISVIAAIMYLIRHKASGLSCYIWLFIIASIFISYTIKLMKKSPEEAIHFIQYGILGFLIYRALTHRIRDISIYLIAAEIGGIIGIIDEALQWAIPTRYWGLADIWLNFFGTSLIQIAIAKGLKPKIICKYFSIISIRWLCQVSAIAVFLLGISFLNTPARIAWYSDRVPLLQYLKTNQSVMFEYGHLYEDPNIGRFRSRLSPDELLLTDNGRGIEAAKVLDKFPDNSTYMQFLEMYTPVNDPFLHEARVHLFCRDRNLEISEKHKEDEEKYRHHLTVAYRENQIMKHYFTNTLKNSNYVLPPEQITFLTQNLLPDYEYESGVGKDLATSISEIQVVGALIIILLGLAMIDKPYSRKKKLKERRN